MTKLRVSAIGVAVATALLLGGCSVVAVPRATPSPAPVVPVQLDEASANAKYLDIVCPTLLELGRRPGAEASLAELKAWSVVSTYLIKNSSDALADPSLIWPASYADDVAAVSDGMLKSSRYFSGLENADSAEQLLDLSANESNPELADSFGRMAKVVGLTDGSECDSHITVMTRAQAGDLLLDAICPISTQQKVPPAEGVSREEYRQYLLQLSRLSTRSVAILSAPGAIWPDAAAADVRLFNADTQVLADHYAEIAELPTVAEMRDASAGDTIRGADQAFERLLRAYVAPGDRVETCRGHFG